MLYQLKTQSHTKINDKTQLIINQTQFYKEAAVMCNVSESNSTPHNCYTYIMLNILKTLYTYY